LFRWGNKEAAMSDIAEIAKAFMGHLSAGEIAKAEAYWAESVVSRENMKGPMKAVRGRAAVHEKSVGWYAAHTVNSFKAEGPFCHGDQFALVFHMDVTRKADGERIKMSEVALYKVKDGKIVEERFFY
jgi:ketosteroid isomerase-like protein